MSRPSSDDLPEGFHYLPDFLSVEEERGILDRINTLAFGTVEMHGRVAKRRVVHFEWRYGYASWNMTLGETIPDWPLRKRAAGLMEEPAEKIEEILLRHYPPEAGIGWHREDPRRRTNIRDWKPRCVRCARRRCSIFMPKGWRIVRGLEITPPGPCWENAKDTDGHTDWLRRNSH